MKHITKWLLLLLALTTSVTLAAVPQWQIIPNESNVTFTGTQNGAPATGNFKKLTGTIVIDPNQLNASHVRIVIDMTSLYMSYSTLVTTLQSADWFNVKQYPEAIFEATHFTKTGSNTYQAEGTLTIKGKTLPITIHFTATSLSNTKGRATGDVTINRLDYGVGQGQWADISLVKNEVQVHFVITALKSP